MSKLVGKSFDTPDSTRIFPSGKVDIVQLGELTVGRLELQPGWKWSECVKPLAATESCMSHHTGITLSGRMKIVMDDGSTAESGPGEVYVIPPGHDAWVVGGENYVGIDYSGMSHYAVAHVGSKGPSFSERLGKIVSSARTHAQAAYGNARERMKKDDSEEGTTSSSS